MPTTEPISVPLAQREQHDRMLAAVLGEFEATTKGAFQHNGDIIALLRAASKLLEQRKESGTIRGGEMVFPGWDFDFITDKKSLKRQRDIREAAYVIMGHDGCDAAQNAEVADVAALLHYVGDMLEE